MTRCTVLAVLLSSGACSEAAGGGDHPPSAPAPANLPKDLPSSTSGSVETAAAPQILESGTGRIRPLALREIDAVIVDVQVRRSYKSTYGVNSFDPALVGPLDLKRTRAGFGGIQLCPPDFGVWGRGSCPSPPPLVRLQGEVSKPTRETYEISVTLRAPEGTRTWTLRRHESNLDVSLPEREGSHESQVFSSVAADLKRIGERVCETVTATACGEL